MVFIRSGAAAIVRTSAAGMKMLLWKLTERAPHPQQAALSDMTKYRSLLAAHLHQSQRTTPHPSINILVSHHITSRRRSCMGRRSGGTARGDTARIPIRQP